MVSGSAPKLTSHQAAKPLPAAPQAADTADTTTAATEAVADKEPEAQAAAKEAAVALLAQEGQAAQAAQRAKKAAKKARQKLRKQVPDRHTQQCSCIHLCEILQRACGRKPTCCTALLRLCCLSQQLKPPLEPRVSWSALCLDSVAPLLLQAARQGQSPNVQQQS